MKLADAVSRLWKLPERLDGWGNPATDDPMTVAVERLRGAKLLKADEDIDVFAVKAEKVEEFTQIVGDIVTGFG